MSAQKTTFHFPLPILVGEGKLILDAATAHSELAARFKAGFLTGAVALLATVKLQVTGEKQKRGDVGVLTLAQLDEIHNFQHLVHLAKESAKLAFKGQAVKLTEQFFVGVNQPNDLQSQLARGRTIVASIKLVANADAIAGQGWTADETTALDNIITAIEGDKTLLENAKGASLGSTGVRNASAESLYAAAPNRAKRGEHPMAGIRPGECGSARRLPLRQIPARTQRRRRARTGAGPGPGD